MGELRDVLTAAGYADVRTHGQSGNVVLTSEAAPEHLGPALERDIAAGLGLEVRVVVRTRDELASVVERDPFGPVAADPRRYQVTFLATQPDPAVVAELAAQDVAPERVVFDGREIFAWHPGGLQKSRLARLLGDRRLGDEATARNWSTVNRLLALADEPR